MRETDNTILFDLDGVLADYAGAIRRDWARIASPNDPPYQEYLENAPNWYMERINMIRRASG